MALPAGNYRLNTQAIGYKVFHEDLQVSDMGKVNMERQKNLVLKKNR
jgi:hypothetical protein